MAGLKDLIVSASVAAGSIITAERDRLLATTEDGRPKSLKKRVPERMRSAAAEGAAKLAISQGAHLGAREIAKRVSGPTLRKIFGVLGKHPAAASGVLFIGWDTMKDTSHFVSGKITKSELTARVAGNFGGVAGSAGGAYAGAAVGAVVIPFVGAFVGSVVGGVLGGVAGEAYAREKVGIDEQSSGMLAEDEYFEDYEP